MSAKIAQLAQVLFISEKTNRKPRIEGAAKSLGIKTTKKVTISTALNELQNTMSQTILLMECDFEDDMTLDLLQRIQSQFTPDKVTVICFLDDKKLHLVSPFIQGNFIDFSTSKLKEDVLTVRLKLAQERLAREEYIVAQGQRDGLTGVLVRDSFLAQANTLYASAVRDQIYISMIMISIERLNGIQLRFGQSTSDQVLVEVSKILRKRKRDTDLLCRFSDHVFCLMTVNLRESHFDTFLDDIVLSCLSPDYKAGLITLNVTANIGVTTSLGHNLNDMLNQAGAALDQSRSKGENEIVIYNDLQTEPVAVRSEHY